VAYKCATCNKIHTDLPHIGFGAPLHWSDKLADDPNSLLTSDLCIIEGRDFFVHGVIEIPVHDYEHEFGWGVWVSHKKENFETYRNNSDSAAIGPFFGWLCNEIVGYSQSTLNLKTMAHYRGGKLRPRIEIGESDHPLYLQQRDGISLAEAWAMVHRADEEIERNNKSGRDD
jgi:hypothetical protein